MFYLMCYTQTRYRRDGNPSVAVGHCVKAEHPLVVVNRWNELGNREREAGRPGSGLTVLNWYRRLTDVETDELQRAGIDPAAIDVSGYVTG